MAAQKQFPDLRRLAALLATGCLCAASLQACMSSDDDAPSKQSLSTPPSLGGGIVPWKQITSGPTASVPPLAGAPIRLELLTDGPAVQGQPYKFVVRISNQGDRPVVLDPCPSYRVQYLPHTEGGYLNCADAPGAIAAGAFIDFQMQVDVLDGHEPITGSYELFWQLGGEGIEGKTVRKDVPIQSIP